MMLAACSELQIDASAELQQLARVAAAVKSMQRAAANQCNSRSVKYGYQSCCYVRFYVADCNLGSVSRARSRAAAS